MLAVAGEWVPPTRSAYLSYKPRACGGVRKLNVKDLALTTVFAALYAVLVIALAGISFQLVQVRVADALIPLSIVFGWPAVIGVTVGCVISNVVSPLPSVLVDITFGAVANFFASLLAWRIGRWKRRSTFNVSIPFTLIILLVGLTIFSWAVQNTSFFTGPWFFNSELVLFNGVLSSLIFVGFLIMLILVSSFLRARDGLSPFLGCLSAALIVTFVVGTYLAVITEMEPWIWWFGIGVGSLISICGIGYSLLEILKRIKLG
jgi:uncharacterized membrane protein